MKSFLPLFILSLLFFGACQLNAQKADVHPLAMVPYNDHGRWGYSDTLANVLIKPRYEKASFYFRRKIGDEIVFLSRVNTSFGENLLQGSGKLLLPKKTNLVKMMSSNVARGSLFILQKKGKYGVYELERGWQTEARFDTLFRYTFNDWVLLRAAADATYTHFNPSTLQTETTDFVYINEYWSDMNTVIVATTAAGEHYRLSAGATKTLLSDEEFSEMESLDGLMLEEMPDDWGGNYHWRGPRPSAESLGVDRTVDFRDYSALSFADRYGFKKAIIAQKDGQMGIVDEKGTILLPFQYDRVEFSDPATEAKLYKDGKMGYKLLFTHHPTIEARYESIEPAIHLPVSRTWNFAVFRVQVDGQQAYVGENAIEFFDLD